MATAASGPSPPGAGQPCRILLVDDNAPGRRALAKMLEALGYEVATASTGQEGITALQQTPAPHIVLTDLVLPDVDGLEVAREARKLSPAPYTILITGWSVDPQTQNPAHYANVDDVFLKPVKIDELVAKLAQVCRPSS